jgi:hypothetical protein
MSKWYPCKSLPAGSLAATGVQSVSLQNISLADVTGDADFSVVFKEEGHPLFQLHE